MQVIMTSIGSQGDLYPLLGIGMALKKRGHVVTVLANAYFEAVTRQAGLDFSSIGSAGEYTGALDVLADATMRQVIIDHLYVRPMKPVYEYLARHSRERDTVAVCNISSLGTRLARERPGMPMVSVNLAPMMFFSSYDPPLFTLNPYPKWVPRAVYRTVFRGARMVFDRQVCPELNRFRRELGLKPQRDVFRWMLSPDKIIGLFPDWFAPVMPDWPVQTELTGFPLFDEGAVSDDPMPDELEAFLSRGTAPVIFTPGTPYRKYTSIFEKAIRATAGLGVRALFVSRFREQIPRDLPPHVLYCPYVPFSRVLPRASALVYHGGIGTMAQALRAGLPQLVAPWGIDQYDNGARVRKLGVGEVISSRTCTADSLAVKLDHILNSGEVREKCRLYAGKTKSGHVLDDICRIIEEVGATPGTCA